MRMTFETISKRADDDAPLSEAQQVVDDDDADAEAGLRERVKARLQRFPEAAALSLPELEVAVERIIVQARSETASPAAPGKVRLSDDRNNILLWAYARLIPSVDELPGVASGGVFPPGWIEARRRELDEECQEENKSDGHGRLGLLLAKIRVDLLTRGYVEVHKEYMQPNYLPRQGN